jgi:hypothetical protein
MSTVHRRESTGTSWAELPAVIRTFLTAQPFGDAVTAARTFAVDAVVIDEGRTYRGREEIQAWLECAAFGFDYTTRFTGASTIGEADFDVVQRLEGNFPRGVVDLHYRFALDGSLIGRLVIEP